MKLPPFQSLVDEYGTSVYRFLVASAGPSDASDVFQETMVSALSAYDGLRDATNLKGWLFTVAHHKAIDHARASNRRPIPVARAPEPPPPPTSGQPGEEDRDLWAAVRDLPDLQRAVVTLRYVGDLSYASIGGILGLTANAARQNSHRGLTALRKELGHD